MPNRATMHLAYRATAQMLRLYSRFAWDLRASGIETIPKGPKIYVCNHVTSVDPYWLLMLAPDFLHFVVGPPYHIRGAGPVLRFFEQINALSQYRKQAVAQACQYLARGEAICICPEGDVQKPFELGHFYTGLAQMYCKTRAPIIPIALAVSPQSIRHHPRWDILLENRRFEARMYWRGRVRFQFGPPMQPECAAPNDENEHRRITDLVRSRIAEMLQEMRAEF